MVRKSDKEVALELVELYSNMGFKGFFVEEYPVSEAFLDGDGNDIDHLFRQDYLKDFCEDIESAVHQRTNLSLVMPREHFKSILMYALATWISLRGGEVWYVANTLQQAEEHVKAIKYIRLHGKLSFSRRVENVLGEIIPFGVLQNVRGRNLRRGIVIFDDVAQNTESPLTLEQQGQISDAFQKVWEPMVNAADSSLFVVGTPTSRGDFISCVRFYGSGWTHNQYGEEITEYLERGWPDADKLIPSCANNIIRASKLSFGEDFTYRGSDYSYLKDGDGNKLAQFKKVNGKWRLNTPISRKYLPNLNSFVEGTIRFFDASFWEDRLNVKPNADRFVIVKHLQARFYRTILQDVLGLPLDKPKS